MVGYYKKMNYITSIGPETHSQSEFYPSDNNFTQALLVMLVTNIISEAGRRKGAQTNKYVKLEQNLLFESHVQIFTFSSHLIFSQATHQKTCVERKEIKPVILKLHQCWNYIFRPN